MSLFDLNNDYGDDYGDSGPGLVTLDDDDFLGTEFNDQYDAFDEYDADPRFIEVNQVSRKVEEDLFHLYPVDGIPGFSGCGQMVISDDTIVYSHPNKPMITKILLTKLDHPKDIVLTKSQDTVRNLFLDPSGKHCLVSMDSGELYYVNWGNKKAQAKSVLNKQVGKMRVYSCAWSMEDPSSGSTREILLGTDGAVYETVIQDNHKTQYFKQVFELDDNEPVCGIHTELYPEELEELDRRALVMVATPTRLYDCVGVPAFNSNNEPIFKAIFNSESRSFQDMPCEDPAMSELRVFSTWGNPSESFAWTNAYGVFHGSLEFDSSDKVLVDTDMVPYPKLNKVETAPLGLLLTRFHFIMLYDERIVGLCHLNKKIVHMVSTTRKETGWQKGLTVDPVTKMLWLFSDSGIFELVVGDEDRDMWLLYVSSERKGNEWGH
eukprot:TRINITY_DN2467_c0_g1_i6.p1 TRINITY_DN2467_c0_g1~~TRINITY_DN2467_c0_g1_i6.p1  ORF type:complete len:434 (+),score=124.70 TRINITY_DN2467_c0_g1_i6:101-1402(+)